MTRLARRDKFNDKLITINNSIFGLIDSSVMLFYRLTEDEFDKLCEITTDEELDLFTKKNLTFCEKRKILLILKEKIYGKDN